MEKYPIFFDGQEKGALTVCGDGLLTVFEANADLRSDVVRLSVYGGGAEGFLGVMEPCNSGLYLKRRLTQLDMRAFPQRIEYAGISGRPQFSVVEPELEPEPEPPPVNLSDDLLWFSTPAGFLTAFDGGRSLIAMPAQAPLAPSGIRKNINGREYVIFPGKGVHK